MKILIVSRYPPFPGGRENFVFELSRKLSKRNQVLILTPDSENKIVNKNLKIKKFLKNKKYLENIINDFNPEIINSHTFYLSNDILKIAKKYKIPFGITLHGDQFAIGDKERQKIVTEISLNSDFVITVSDNGKESLLKNVQDIIKKKIFVIKNGVNLKRFKKVGSLTKNKYKKEFGILKSKKVILTASRLAEYKGMDFLFNFIKNNRTFIEKNNIFFVLSIPDYKLSNEEKKILNNIKNIIKKEKLDSIVKIIFLSYFEIKKAYDISDCFLLPSEKEQFPISILEAASCQLSIIATSVGGIPELLNKKDLVKYNNQEQLLKLIRKKNKINFKDNFYSKKISFYSIDNVSEKYMKIYFKYAKENNKN